MRIWNKEILSKVLDWLQSEREETTKHIEALILPTPGCSEIQVREILDKYATIEQFDKLK